MTSADSTQPLVAAADGSALGNPGPAGWAWYVDEQTWRAGGWPHGTNNMGELQAVLDLLESTADRPERELRILCDSQYVINCITKWMPGWKRNGWKKKDKKPVLNRDLLEALDAALQGRTYSFEWVKGHAGHPLNEAADERARAAATAFRDGREPRPGPGFSGRETDRAEEADGTDEAVETATAEAAEAGGPERAGGMEDTAPAPATDVVLDLEQGLGDERTYRDPEALDELLDEELLWVTARGRRAGKKAALAYPQEAFGLEAEPEILSCTARGRDAVLVVSGVQGARGRLLRSSLWTRSEGTAWVLSVRQDTPVL